MYDRKTWIGLILCTAALFVYFYFSGQNRTIEAEAAKKKTEQEQAASVETQATNPQEANTTADPSAPAEATAETISEQTHTLKTKDTVFTFTNKGGGVQTAEILKEFAVNDPSSTIKLNDQAKAPIGALGTTADTFVEANLNVHNSSDSHVHYVGKTSSGLLVEKIWELVDHDNDFKKDGSPYQLRLKLTIRNPKSASSSVNLSSHNLFLGAAAPLYAKEWDNQTIWCFKRDGDFKQKHSSYFKGGFFGSAKSLFKEYQEDIEYAGVSNQFFLTLLTPETPYSANIWAKQSNATIPDLAGGDKLNKEKKAIRSGLYLPDATLQPGEEKKLTFTLFTGPKKNIMIRELQKGEAMNYGMFGIISNVLNRLMNFLHNLIGDSRSWGWGLAIIFVTVIIRIVIWPLHNKSQRTMKRMSKLQPKMAEIKEKHADNPEKMNRETMALYRDFGVNPMGGCLPMLLQIPIFFGFYRMLQYAVELRGKEFLWVPDLSQPDTIASFDLPFHVPILGTQLDLNLLPILMAVTMFLQMKLTPTTGDKMQQRIFMFMPFMFFFFCYNFASALALYWTTQNIFSIGQTLLMKRLPEPELKKNKNSGKKGFMQKLQERAEEAQKQRNQMAKQQKQASDPNAPQKPKKPRGPKTGG